MLKVKYHIILCFFTILLVQGKLCAQNDSIKKPFSFVQFSGGLGATNINAPIYSFGYVISLTTDMQLKHSHWGLGLSISSNQNKFNADNFTDGGPLATFPNGHVVTALNAEAGIFLQLPLFNWNYQRTKGIFYAGLLAGVLYIKIPEYEWSDTAGQWTSQSWYNSFAIDEFKTSAMACTVNFKTGLLIVPLAKRFVIGLMLDALYANLNFGKGLPILTKYTEPLPYPPKVYTNEVIQHVLFYYDISFTIGFKID